MVARLGGLSNHQANVYIFEKNKNGFNRNHNLGMLVASTNQCKITQKSNYIEKSMNILYKPREKK